MSESAGATYYRDVRKRALSRMSKFNQGLGAIPDTILNYVFGTFILLYYNQILGLDAFLVSLALGVAIVIDAVIDPTVATVSDSLHTRWGRRHPLMLAGSVVFGFTTFLVFAPPHGLGQWGLFVWLLVFVLLTRAAMSIYFVPWAAIAAELSDDYIERTSIMSWRFAVGWFVGVLFPFLVLTFLMRGTPQHPFGQLNPAAYPPMALAAGVLMLAGGLATTLMTAREIPYLRRHLTAPPRPGPAVVVREAMQALGNDQFALIFTIVLISAAISGTGANIGALMVTFFWRLTSEDLRWFGLSAVGAVFAIGSIGWFQQRFDKKDILLWCALFNLVDGMVMVSLRLAHILPPNSSPLLLPLLITDVALTTYVGVVQGIIGASIVADILDLHELRTGLRQEGMFNAALSFSGKAVSGVGIVLGGLLLKVLAIPPHMSPSNVSPDIVMRLGVAAGLVIPAFHLIPILLISRYRLSRAAHAEVLEQLAARRQAASYPQL